MIECSDENIFYKNRRKRYPKKRKKFFWVFIFLLIIASIICYFKYVVTPEIVSICKSYSYSYSTEAVNSSVLKSMTTDIKYSDIINVEKNSAGEIVMIGANSYTINSLNKKIATKTEQELKDKFATGVPIPLLAFSGIKLLSGYGPIINFNSIVVSSVVCDFVSKFESVGINQTRHSIYIEVKNKIDINIPLSNNYIENSTLVLVSETVLIGDVPNVYLGGNIFGK